MSLLLTPFGERDVRDVPVGGELVYFDTVTGEEKRNILLGKERYTPERFQTWVVDVEAAEAIPGVLDEEGNVVTEAVPEVLEQGHHEQDEFTFYKINDIAVPLFKNQSIWRLDPSAGMWRVTHAKLLQVGDTICDGANEDVIITSIEIDLTQTEWWRLEVSGDHSVIADGLTLHNASRFWVGGTGNWDASTTTNWGSADGLADGASVPTSDDDVDTTTLSNATDYTLTITATANCNNFTMGAPLTGKVTWAGSSAINIYGSMNLSGGTAGITRSYSGAITFKATATGKTVTTNAVAVKSLIVFNGAGGGWTLQDAFAGDQSSFTLTAGGVDTNGQTAAFGEMIIGASASTRALTLGASAVSTTGYYGSWKCASSTGLTFDAGTSTITITDAGQSPDWGGLTYYNVVVNNGGAATSPLAAGTFTNLSFIGAAAYTGSVVLAANYTVSGTFTATGNSAKNRLLIKSSVVGTARTITAAAVSLTDVDFTDITGAGAASPFTGTRLGNAAGNSGITFTTAAPKYWNKVAGGNWNATDAWATSDGGATSADNFPLPQDTATFTDTGLNNSTTVTVNGAFRLPSIDFSGLTRTGVTFATGSNACPFYGDLKLTTAGTFAVSGTGALTASGRNTQTITSSGVSWTQPFTVDSIGGTYTLADNQTLPATITFTLTKGTLNLNGQTLSTGKFSSSNSNIRSITAGGGGITLTHDSTGGTGVIWVMTTGTNFTLNDALTVTATNAATIPTNGRTIDSNVTEANAPSFNITGGSDFVRTDNGKVKNWNLTGFTGIWNNGYGALTLYGNLTVPSGLASITGTMAITCGATSGTQLITTNAAGALDFPITVNAPGATVQLADNLTLGTTRTLTHTAGTIDLAGKNLVPGRFATSGSTARTVTDSVGGGKIATADTTAATVFYATTTTNLTVTRTNPWTIEIGGDTTNIRTVNLGAGKEWPDITFTNTTANGELDIVSSGTATVIKSLAVSVPPQTIKRTAATTIGIEDANGMPAGTSGNLVTIGSITAATHTWARSGAAGALTTGYLSISRSTAPADWDAGATSTDGGNNVGWLFGAVGIAMAKVMHHLKMLRG